MCETCERYRRSEAAPWHGRHSRTALREACAEMGVALPVTVRAAVPDSPHPAGGRWTPGNFGCWSSPESPENESGGHLVTVRWDLPHDVANESLLHELAHAAQYEAEGGVMALRLYALGERMFGYRDNPLESEARESAARLRSRFSIARAGA